MAIRVAKSSAPGPTEAAAEINKGLEGDDLALVVYFVSSSYSQEELASALQRELGGVRTLGCSTAGELVSGEVTKGALVAMGFGKDDLSDLDVRWVEDITSEAALDRALDGFEDHFQRPVSGLPIDEYVGLVLMDGLSGAEERVMDHLGNRTDLLFVGGSAGDDLAFEKTFVHADGRARSGAAVLAILRPTRGYDVIKTQSFEPSGVRLVASAVDEARRTVREFNGKPAAMAYAEAVGVPLEELPGTFMARPLGLMLGDEPYVRSPQQVQDGAIRFYCAVKEGCELDVLTSTDIVGDTRAALQEKVVGGAAGLLNFNCILRTLDLEQTGQTAAYGEVFRELPTVGLSTYGEAYLGHINQTATMVLFR